MLVWRTGVVLVVNGGGGGDSMGVHWVLVVEMGWMELDDMAFGLE